MASKVLALGPPSPSPSSGPSPSTPSLLLAPFLAKLANLHAKHAFACAVVSGDFFPLRRRRRRREGATAAAGRGQAAAGEEEEGEEEEEEVDKEVTALLEGELKVPLPTYITSSDCSRLPSPILSKLALALPSLASSSTAGGTGTGDRPIELCPNLFFLADAVVQTPLPAGGGGGGRLTIGAFSAGRSRSGGGEEEGQVEEEEEGRRRAILSSRFIPLDNPPPTSTSSSTPLRSTGGSSQGGSSGGGDPSSSFASLQAAALAAKQTASSTGAAASTTSRAGAGAGAAGPQGIDLLLLPGGPPPGLLTSSPSCPAELKGAWTRVSLSAGGGAGGGAKGESAALEEVVRRSRARYIFFPPPPPPPSPPPSLHPSLPSPLPSASSSSSSVAVATAQGFFEREPYPSDPSSPSPSVVTGGAGKSNPAPAAQRYTRAFQLARFVPPASSQAAAAAAGGGPPPPPTKPARSFYAFNLTPLDGSATTPTPPPAAAAVPANVTANPFAPSPSPAAAAGAGGKAGGGMKRSREPLEEQGFIWGQMPGSGSSGGGKAKRGRKDGGEGGGQRAPRERKEPIMMAECWFCLSNPNVTKHLITAISDEVYVTLPKGPLIPTPKEGKVVLVEGVPEERGREEGVPGGGHVLIIPISHHTTIASIPADDKPLVNAEIGSVLGTLRRLYADFGRSAVGFEVGRLSARGGHAHVQVVPVPTALASQVEGAFRTEGAKTGMVFEEKQSLEGEEGRSYFRLILPDGRQLIAWLEPRQRFDLQFGRSVLANLLGLGHRLDWKACLGPNGGSEADEKRDALAFKKAFERAEAAESSSG